MEGMGDADSNDINNMLHEDLKDEESLKRREMLARRPSYRKILNDLSAGQSDNSSTMDKIQEEEPRSENSDNDDSQHGTLFQSGNGTVVIPAGAIQIQSDGGNPALQTLTMSNSSGSNPSAATIVQYAQGPDGQLYIPASNMQAYQISPATSLALAGSSGQNIVMTSGMGSLQSDEASRKRELRLLKNRDAAKECRRKKKEYVKCLENRVAVLENQNKALIEELKSLKELYCQKDLV